jgi:hypothetical protein
VGTQGRDVGVFTATGNLLAVAGATDSPAVTAPTSVRDETTPQRSKRVRFKHHVRVTTIDGEPRAWRTLASNLSRDGLFVRMPQPLEPGTRVAISLEAKGQALPLAQGEVRWCRRAE